MVCVLALVAADNVHSEMVRYILFHHLYTLYTRVGRGLGAYGPASTCPKDPNVCTYHNYIRTIHWPSLALSPKVAPFTNVVHVLSLLL